MLIVTTRTRLLSLGRGYHGEGSWENVSRVSAAVKSVLAVDKGYWVNPWKELIHRDLSE